MPDRIGHDLVDEFLSHELVRVQNPLAEIEHPEPWFSLGMSFYGNWKIYVPEIIQEHWYELSLEARAAVYLTALDQVRRQP